MHSIVFRAKLINVKDIILHLEGSRRTPFKTFKSRHELRKPKSEESTGNLNLRTHDEAMLRTEVPT